MAVDRYPLQPLRFDPPLERMRCPECGDEWDAWIADNGTPEDLHDLFCDCGTPAQPKS